jgi:molecular chaperone GrpE
MSKHFSHDKKNHKGPAEGEKLDDTPEQPVDPGAEAGMARDASRNQSGAENTDAGDPENRAPGDTAADKGTGGPAGEAETRAAGPEDRIADLEARLAEAKDQFLRKAADFENFRKRMNREKQDAVDFANQGLLSDIIPILDDFDRALGSAESSRDFNALYEGLGMIAKRFSSTLESKWGLKSYTAAGAPFDPNFHEALMMEKSSAVTEQTVQADLLKGYTLKDRVIRSAKVKVLIPDPSAPAVPVSPAPEEAAPGTGEAGVGETGTGEGARGVQTGEAEAQP